MPLLAIALGLMVRSLHSQAPSLCALSLSLQARTWLALWALREFAYDLGYGVPWASVMHGSPSLLLIHPLPVWRQLIIWVSSHSLPLGHLGLDARGTAV